MSEAGASSGPARLTGPLLVVGTGLLGTSIGLAASRAGLEVWLADARRKHVRTASGLGAGSPAPQGGVPQLVVVAVPPDHIADVVVDALGTGAVVTDVGSVKQQPLDAVRARVDATTLARYVGGHPMAGSERSGPLAASAALFDGRPWAVTAHAGSDPAAVQLVDELVGLCGAQPVHLDPAEHDRAVARTSHVPHLLAVLAAGRLVDAPTEHLTLSGQGVRDVTRIAAGDPELYGQIIRANRAAVADLLVEVRADLDRVIEAVGASAAAEALGEVLARGVSGTRVIPGKHGGPALETAAVFIVVPDHPGELARLFADVGEIGVNIEDVRIDHDPGRPVGLVELQVAADAADGLEAALADRSWTTHR
jgi:prephenate dehydrogenase